MKVTENMVSEFEARIPEFVDKWYANATQSINKDEFESVMTEIYRHLNLTKPEFVYLSDPILTLLTSATAEAYNSRSEKPKDKMIKIHLGDRIDNKLKQYIKHQYSDKFWKAISKQINNSIRQNYWQRFNRLRRNSITNIIEADMGALLNITLDRYNSSDSVISNYITKVVKQVSQKLKKRYSGKVNQWDIHYNNLKSDALWFKITNNFRQRRFYIKSESWYLEAAWFDLARTIGITFDQQKLDTLLNFYKQASWIIPYKKVCFVSEKPEYVSWNSEGRLHAEAKPAISFRKALSLWCYDGVRLSRKRYQINPKYWKAEWLLDEDNAEIRRILIQALGLEKILADLKAVSLGSWREYELLKLSQEIDFVAFVILKMTCPSTKSVHCLRVPPDLTDAREAIKWINHGIDPEKFIFET